MLIGLLVIMAAANLVPIFVVNNVDYATHLGIDRFMQVALYVEVY